MDLTLGFQIERPGVFIHWGISERQLQQVLSGEPTLRRVTDGYWVIECTSLNRLRHKMGFHFGPRVDGRLIELEVFENELSYGSESFSLFQRHLEETFGSPTETHPGTEGFPSHRWSLDGADVLHFVRDHFGPEENVRIKWQC